MPTGRDYTPRNIICPHCGKDGRRICRYKNSGDVDVIHETRTVLFRGRAGGMIKIEEVYAACSIHGKFGTKYRTGEREIEIKERVVYGQRGARRIKA